MEQSQHILQKLSVGSIITGLEYGNEVIAACDTALREDALHVADSLVNHVGRLGGLDCLKGGDTLVKCGEYVLVNETAELVELHGIVHISYRNGSGSLLLSYVHSLSQCVEYHLLTACLRIIHHIHGPVGYGCDSIFGIVVNSQLMQHHQCIHQFLLADRVVAILVYLLSHDLHTVEKHILAGCGRAVFKSITPAGSSTLKVTLLYILLIE